MVSKEKIESYILEMELPYQEIENDMWIILEEDDPSAPQIVVSYSEEIVHFRMKIGKIPTDNNTHCALFRKLLGLNAAAIIHGSYAIEDDFIVILDTLETENLDFNEFQASIESIFLSLVENYDELSKYLS